MTSEISTASETLNDRLRRRREDLGASVDKAASWAGLDSERLEEIEGGAPLHSWELDAVCRGLAVDSGALARGGDRSPRRSVARFKAASRSLSLAAELGRIGGFLAERTGISSRLADLRAPEPVSAGSETWKQGYRLGENARRALEPRTGPIIDLEALLRGWRVHVARVAHSFDLWIDLPDEGAITPAELQRLCERTRGRDSGLNRMPERTATRFPRE